MKMKRRGFFGLLGAATVAPAALLLGQEKKVSGPMPVAFIKRVVAENISVAESYTRRKEFGIESVSRPPGPMRGDEQVSIHSYELEMSDGSRILHFNGLPPGIPAYIERDGHKTPWMMGDVHFHTPTTCCNQCGCLDTSPVDEDEWTRNLGYHIRKQGKIVGLVTLCLECKTTQEARGVTFERSIKG